MPQQIINAPKLTFLRKDLSTDSRSSLESFSHSLLGNSPTLVKSSHLENAVAGTENALEVSLLTGGIDRPYAYGLAMALVASGVRLDVIGNEFISSPEMHSTPNLRFLDLWPRQSAGKTALGKLWRVLGHYIRLIRYAATAKPGIFHILWNSKIQLFDRTLLMLYYKVLGKKVALTAHNVNQAKRDLCDTWLNRATLTIQYRLANHIFVHTEKMKTELSTDFDVAGERITVIRHPINNAFPDTGLDARDAKSNFGLSETDKTILCFGRIKPYKGIEYLLRAFEQLAATDESYRLIIAGDVEREGATYMASLMGTISQMAARCRITLNAQYISDEKMEVYFKAADVLVLPYKDIFQSGVLFLGYSFGLPVIATDVGSFREEILDGKTGYLCRPGDPEDLGRTIATFFASELYRDMGATRKKIRHHANTYHSWAAVARRTREAYEMALGMPMNEHST